MAKGTGLRSSAALFAHCRSGIAFLKFALMLPVMLAIVLSGIDYAWTLTHKSVLQDAADVAAIAGAKQLSLSDSNKQNVEAVVTAMVERYVAENRTPLTKMGAAPPKVKANITSDPLQVEVLISQQVQSAAGGKFGLEFPPINVRSVARISGQPNICVLALSSQGGTGILLENSALVTGRNCAVFSNSASKSGLRGRNSSLLTASFICSAGGAEGSGNFSPPPMVDCPSFSDPLSDRPAPLSGPCVETDLKISGGSRDLSPGTYCGGLKISGGADVRFLPGEYIIKDGPLSVDSGGRITGVDVGFYLTGKGAVIDFNRDSSISLEAPKSGSLAGILVYEDRNQSIGNPHIIYSNDARVLLGTIYIPRGMLMVDASSPVADQSAYTAIVADQMRLKGGPHLILNTDYDKTKVPVPKGIRGAGQPVSLVQ